jgi:tetratricopeptide (TPR) repeat protein
MGSEKLKGLILPLLFFLVPLSSLFSQTEDSTRIFEQNKQGILTLVAYGENKAEIAKGSGFGIYDEVIATSYHLMSNAFSVEGINIKGKKIKVEGIISADKNLDLVLLKVKGNILKLTLGNSDELGAGKRVFAVGANESGTIAISEGTVRGFLELSPNQRIVDTSLSIPEGFSGGPLLNLEGQVQGIVIVLDKELKFVVPVNSLKILGAYTKPTEFKNWQHKDYLSIFEGAYLAGRVYALMDNFLKAQRDLDKVIKINPNLVEAHALLASVYSRQRDYQAAISAYQKVIELDKNRGDVYFGLGLVYLKMQRQEDAIPPLQRAIELNYNPKDSYYNLATALEQTKDFAKGAEAYENYLKLKPEDTWTGYLRLGLCRMELNQYESAVQAFQEAQKLKPQDLKTNYSLALAYQKAGQLDKAEETFKNLAQINPQDASTYYGQIIEMYDKVGNSPKALEAAQKVVELNPQSDLAVYNLGIMYFKLEKYDEAIDSFRRALAIKPNTATTYYQIGYTYSKQKKFKESIEAFKKYIELSPDDAYGWVNIGVGYMQMKDFESALEPLRKCVELKPDYADAQYNLAIVYLNLKDNFSAKEIYKILLTLNPDLAQKLRKYLK